jgi:hypothetical protein
MSNTKSDIVKIQIRETGLVSSNLLKDVVRQLRAMIQLLEEFAETTPNAYIEVVSLSKNSPLEATVRTVVRDTPDREPNRPQSVIRSQRKTQVKTTTRPIRRLETVFKRVRSGKLEKGDVESAMKIADFAKTLGSDEATITTSNGEYEVNAALLASIESKIGIVHRSKGTASGQIKNINIHASPHTFYIYPEAGPSRIRCVFNKSLLHHVGSATRDSEDGRLPEAGDGTFAHRPCEDGHRRRAGEGGS